MQVGGRRFVGFDWDDGNSGKGLRHGVSDEEIQEALLNTPIVDHLAERFTNEVRLRALGETAAGRRLVVIYTFRVWSGDRLLRPITAYDMDRGKRRRYDRRKGR